MYYSEEMNKNIQQNCEKKKRKKNYKRMKERK